MKLLSGAAATLLAGFALAATQQEAQVYILQPDSKNFPSSAPRIPKEAARHILLQRAARDRYGLALDDIPAIVDQETAVAHLNTYSKAPSPLFSDADAENAAQLVLIIEGVDKAVERRFATALTAYKPAFLVSNPPSYFANDRLMDDFNTVGVPQQPETCSVESAFNPFDAKCWKSSSSVARYDVHKHPELVQDFIENVPRLIQSVQAGELEAAILFLPESGRFAPVDSWTLATRPSDLRRRAATFEEPISDDFANPKKAGSSSSSPNSNSQHAWAAAAANKAIPACFQTFNSCVAATGGCSGHGLCLDKYENDTRTKSKCFSCSCLSSVVDTEVGRSTTHWGGAMCQKIDISTPFWLIAGFTIVIVWAVAFAVGMLFSVGEEKLPGVIGAGVSRSK